MVSTKRGGERRMEGQVKVVFRAWMSREPYGDVTVRVQKTPCQSFFSLCLTALLLHYTAAR